MVRRPPTYTRFPYTTLLRSVLAGGNIVAVGCFRSQEDDGTRAGQGDGRARDGGRARDYRVGEGAGGVRSGTHGERSRAVALVRYREADGRGSRSHGEGGVLGRCGVVAVGRFRSLQDDGAGAGQGDGRSRDGGRDRKSGVEGKGGGLGGGRLIKQNNAVALVRYCAADGRGS